MLFGYDTLTGGKLTCFKYAGIYQFPFLVTEHDVCLLNTILQVMFSRPIRWVLALHGDVVIPFAFAGVLRLVSEPTAMLTSFLGSV